MQIIESDFKIEHDGACFVLYFFKSKKELKEDSVLHYKIAGYYTDVVNAFYAVEEWRRDKKYPFSEPADIIKQKITEYRRIKKQLVSLSMILYKPILDFKKNIQW